MESFFKFMAEWGLWEIINLIIVLIPSVLVVTYLFPRKAIKNFYVDAQAATWNEPFSRLVRLELRNHTNEPLYVLSEGFKFGSTIRPLPFAAKDAATGIVEVKFEGRERGDLTEIDALVRSNQKIATWIPVHPDESLESIPKSYPTTSGWAASPQGAEDFDETTSIHAAEDQNLKVSTEPQGAGSLSYSASAVQSMSIAGALKEKCREVQGFPASSRDASRPLGSPQPVREARACSNRRRESSITVRWTNGRSLISVAAKPQMHLRVVGVLRCDLRRGRLSEGSR
jgi:hypothetical protein